MIYFFVDLNWLWSTFSSILILIFLLYRRGQKDWWGRSWTRSTTKLAWRSLHCWIQFRIRIFEVISGHPKKAQHFRANCGFGSNSRFMFRRFVFQVYFAKFFGIWWCFDVEHQKFGRTWRQQRIFEVKLDFDPFFGFWSIFWILIHFCGFWSNFWT